MSRMSQAFTELQQACTRNEAGIHFTEWMDYHQYLESVGLIRIHRPIHEATSIPYSQEHWTLEITPLGQDSVLELS